MKFKNIYIKYIILRSGIMVSFGKVVWSSRHVKVSTEVGLGLATITDSWQNERHQNGKSVTV